MQKRFCVKCGREMNGEFCTHCGARAASVPPGGGYTQPGGGYTTPIRGGRGLRSIRTGIEPLDRLLAGKSTAQLVAMVAIILDIILMLILMLVDYFVWKGSGHIASVTNPARKSLYSAASFYIWLPFMLIHIGVMVYALWLTYIGRLSTVFLIMLALTAALIVFWIADGVILGIYKSNMSDSSAVSSYMGYYGYSDLMPDSGANPFLASLYMGIATYTQAGLISFVFILITMIAVKVKSR